MKKFKNNIDRKRKIIKSGATLKEAVAIDFYCWSRAGGVEPRLHISPHPIDHPPPPAPTPKTTLSIPDTPNQISFGRKHSSVIQLGAFRLRNLLANVQYDTHQHPQCTRILTRKIIIFYIKCTAIFGDALSCESYEFNEMGTPRRALALELEY